MHYPSIPKPEHQIPTAIQALLYLVSDLLFQRTAQLAPYRGLASFYILNGEEINIFIGVGVVLALGGEVPLRSGGPTIRAARGHVRGTGRLPSIAQGAFFFCATHGLAQKLAFLPSFGRAKEKKKVFQDEPWAETLLAS